MDCICHACRYPAALKEYFFFGFPTVLLPIIIYFVLFTGFKWDSVDGNEFSCPPQIHTVNTHFYKHIGNNVTITCPVTGFPQPVVFWLFETTTPTIDVNRYLSTATPSSTVEPTVFMLDVTPSRTEFKVTLPMDHVAPIEQVLPGVRYSVTEDTDNHMLTSTLTVHSLLPIDTQRITCMAQNVGGIVGKNFTLIVSTQEPFSSSRSMDFIVTEMFVIFVSIAILLLSLVIFFAIFIARYKKRSSSHLVHSMNSHGVYHLHSHDNTGSQEPSQPNQYTKEPAQLNGKEKQMLSNNGDFLAFSNQIASVEGGSVPNGNVSQSANVLMVNTIDMIQSAIDLQKAAAIRAASAGINFPSDPNSTDLSSQSTTATSMTINSGNGAVSPNQNQNNTGNSDSSGSVYYSGPTAQLLSANQSTEIALFSDPNVQIPSQQYFSYSGDGVTYSTYAPNYRPLNHTPDLLSSNMAPPVSYYLSSGESLSGTVTTVTTTASISVPTRVNLCDYQRLPQSHQVPSTSMYPSAYPLLNTNRLLETSGELIYGTRITPTQFTSSYGGNVSNGSHNSRSYQNNLNQFIQNQSNQQNKPTKVKFADEVDAKPTLTDEQQQMTRTAYTFGTLRKRPTMNSTNGNEQQLKPIGTNHRTVASYPEGFDSLLVESSVDSGEPIIEYPQSKQSNHRTTTSDSLDETEEDNYYRNMPTISQAPSQT